MHWGLEVCIFNEALTKLSTGTTFTYNIFISTRKTTIAIPLNNLETASCSFVLYKREFLLATLALSPE